MNVNPMIVFRKEFDGNALLFNSDNGDTFGLNRTAAFIWECLTQNMDKSEILESLKKATELPESAEADLDVFIAELKDKGYLAE